MDFEAEVGSIIEFDDGDSHRLAIVVDTVGKTKLVIHTADGDQMRTTEEEITFFLGSDSAGDRQRAQKKLAELDATVEGRRNDVDLEMAWEFVREDDEPMTARDLAELIFADDAPPTVLAVLRALRDNPVYFKSRRDGAFEPRADGQVASLRRQMEAEAEQQRERRQILDEIAGALDLAHDQRAATIEEAMGNHDGLRDAMYLLQDFAAHGQDFARRDDAVELLDELLEVIDIHLDGHMDQKAFYLMRELDLWDEHYNVYLHRFRIDRQLPKPLIAEAEEMAGVPWEPEEFRRDMTGWTTITIDAESSRDLDDALSCRPTIDGGWELAIHIADPSAHVDAGSALDEEARSRGTSIYLPTGSIPMFPRALSEERMSLLPERTRPAMTTLVIFDESLEIVDTEHFPSTIRVDRRLSYDDVDQMLTEGEEGRYGGLVQRLEFIADECHNRRTDEGGFSFDLPESRIVVDDDGDEPTVQVESLETNTPSRSLVSELMILNNTLVGRFCSRHDLPAIYRIQESPDQDLLDEEILAIPEGVARCFAQIRRMKPGDISSQPGPHFGLGLYHYAQASSPIRRYTDLICQRQVKAFVTEQKLPYDEEAILAMLGDMGRAASSATTTQRATDRYWLLYYLTNHGDEPMEAIVVDHYDDRGDRVSVFLTDCAYRSKCSLRTRVPVGESVQVVVDQCDPRRDVLSLRQAPQT